MRFYINFCTNVMSGHVMSGLTLLCADLRFGLSPASPPLQSPFCHSCPLLLDFLLPPFRLKVHSVAISRSFWTSSCLLSASRSNPPLFCTSQQKVDTTLYFYTSFNEHNTPYTVLESDNSESMPDVLH